MEAKDTASQVIITLMFNVRFGREALETYRSEAKLNESRIFETEQQTQFIIDNATEQDHLEFTGRIWFMEFGPVEVIYDPVIKIYYKHTDVSKGIALAEYVAISSLIDGE